MTFTVTNVRRMRPADLATAAEQVRLANKEFGRSLDEVLKQAEKARASWTGIGGDAAFERAGTEVTLGRRILMKVDDVAKALDDGAERLGSATSSVVMALNDTIADRFDVHDRDWTVSHTVPEDKDEPKREQARLNHEATLQARLKTLIAEDEKVGFAIDSAIDEASATGEDVAAGRTYLPPPSLVGMTLEQVAATLADPRFQEWVKNHPDAAKGLLDAAFDAGKLPQGSPFYRDFLKGYWQREALEQAGIDPDTWDPSKGVDPNRANITKVYEYYGRLFMDHPYMQWAGMANMIGPSFAGGFYDLNMLKKIAKAAGYPPQLEPLKNLNEGEIAWYEKKFLSMQKEIFYDQAGMHEAYLHGGVGEIDRMQKAGVIDPQTKNFWGDIDYGVRAGDAEAIAKGNKGLLYREQHDIIDDDYQDMYERPVTGRALTYALGIAGTPSIPGAQSFMEVYYKKYSLDVPIPLGPGVPVPPGAVGSIETTLTLPDGNIAGFNDRWKLIEDDTLPAYQETLQSGQARAIVDSDFNSRLNDQRMVNHIGEILDRLLDADYKPPWER